MAAVLEIGSAFAGYAIEEEIGRGGMGVVYRATDLSLERPVALKLIAPELASDEGFRKRFLKESRLAASLDHPHVLQALPQGVAPRSLARPPTRAACSSPPARRHDARIQAPLDQLVRGGGGRLVTPPHYACVRVRARRSQTHPMTVDGGPDLALREY